MIDTTKPIRFYDDTGSGEDFIMEEILFENDKVCLCTAGENTILFDKHTRVVSCTELDFYYAENIEDIEAIC